MTTAKNKHNFRDLRSEILRQRYLKKDGQGKFIETPEQMFRRVANTIAAVEAKYDATDSQIKYVAGAFYRLMVDSIFLPNSPTLMNAGRENSMLSACFVLPIEDSIDGIFDAVKNTALIQKAGGGTGFSFDRLRPTGDHVASSGGTTSGPISFWRVFSETTNAIQQGAFRRGANMGMMSVGHPDILKFLYAKQNLDAFTNFNISVKITDDWMKQVLEGGKSLHIVKNPRTGQRYLLPRKIHVTSYTINDLHKLTGKQAPGSEVAGQFYTISDIWKTIVKCAHKTGEPGIVFIDRINRDNPTPSLGPIEATNPCGEQPLLPYEACTLGSINLRKFVIPINGRIDMDWVELAKTIELAVRFLDNSIDVCDYPVPETLHLAQANRKIGLGIMGFADALVLLGTRYDSKEAVEFAEKLACFIKKHAHGASEELAKQRGCFPNWKESIWNTKYHRPMRNATCTTIAPTGSIGIMAGCSSGIEPIFSIVSTRQALDGLEFTQLHPLVEELGVRDGWLSDNVYDLLHRGVSPKIIQKIPKGLSDVLVTAHEISPEYHVQIQAVFQRHIDNSVSKTVNLPSGATVKAVDKVYRLAFELGCKGITVYRDESNQDQVLVSSPGKREKKGHLQLRCCAPYGIRCHDERV